MAINWRYVKWRALRPRGRPQTSVTKKNAVRADERRDGCSTQHRAPAIILPLGIERQMNAIHTCIVAADVHADLLRIGGMSRQVGLTDSVSRRGEQQRTSWQCQGTKQPRTSPGWKKDKPAFPQSPTPSTTSLLRRSEDKTKYCTLSPVVKKNFLGVFESSGIIASENGEYSGTKKTPLS